MRKRNAKGVIRQAIVTSILLVSKSTAFAYRWSNEKNLAGTDLNPAFRSMYCCTDPIGQIRVESCLPRFAALCYVPIDPRFRRGSLDVLVRCAVAVAQPGVNNCLRCTHSGQYGNLV
ncbi:hypothetical protein EV426DRAFT_602225 [Tirmania nivea]|nr:hypothetical protein EV426DRAFT_602225 [Tirmania nivea]